MSGVNGVRMWIHRGWFVLMKQVYAPNMEGFFKSLRQRGLHGVEFVIRNDHQGLRNAIAEIMPEAIWQRYYVHFLRDVIDYLRRKANDDCLKELRWLYDRRNIQEA